MYTCLKCNKTFTRKTEYTRHMNRKTPCDKQLVSDGEIKCSHCNKKFKHPSALYYHIKNNVCKKIFVNENNIIHNNQTIHNTNVNNTKIDNININVEGFKMVKFGQEDLSSIKDDIYKKILNSGFKSVPNLIEHVHFNPQNPDNQNIYISNMQNTFVLVYDGEKWDVKDRDDVIEELMYSKTDHLLEKFDSLINELPTKAINKFQRFIDKKDDDKIIEKMKKDIKMILYNNRSLPINIRKKLDLKDEIDDDDDEYLIEDDNQEKIRQLEDVLGEIEKDKIEQILKILNN